MKNHALSGLESLLEESRGALQKRIRVRAYQLYEQRGRQDSHDLDDWLQAEMDVSMIGENSRATAIRIQPWRKSAVALLHDNVTPQNGHESAGSAPGGRALYARSLSSGPIEKPFDESPASCG